jgi:hypothetical protein
MTQSGHRCLSVYWFLPVRCPVFSLGGLNEAARVHKAGLRFSSSSRLAFRGVRAATRADAAHWHVDEHHLGRSRRASPRRRIPAGLAAIGLVRRPVCTENLIHVDEMRESPKLTRWLRFYALCLRSWPRP